MGQGHAKTPLEGMPYKRFFNDISNRDATYLFLFWKSGKKDATSPEIAETLGIRPTNLANFLPDLVRDGYLEKRWDRKYSMTKKGRERAETMQSNPEFMELIAKMDKRPIPVSLRLDKEGERHTIEIRLMREVVVDGKTVGTHMLGTATFELFGDSEKTNELILKELGRRTKRILKEGLEQ